MKIFVCQRSAVSQKTRQVGATHVLSLLDPGSKRPFLHPHTDPNNWRLFHFEDVLEEHETNSPTREHVAEILQWGRALPNDAVVLVHCEAGVSRSTAAALALLVQHHGIDKIDECIQLLLDVRPFSCPNPLITRFADEQLGCNGELHKKAEVVANAKIVKMINE
jgi:predicted protein tyrosine phosphatase